MKGVSDLPTETENKAQHCLLLCKYNEPLPVFRALDSFTVNNIIVRLKVIS